MARDNQLSKLFVRTDTRGPPATTLTGRQALVQLLAMKPGVTQRKTLSPAQARKILTDMRYAQPRPKTPAELRAELTRMRYSPYETAEMAGLHENN